MNTARIDATLAQLTDDEIADGLWIIDVRDDEPHGGRRVAAEDCGEAGVLGA
jgi:hypothetical protein